MRVDDLLKHWNPKTMGRFESTPEFDGTYSFEKFALNQGKPASALNMGEFSKLTGIDGRYRGVLRVFPGFTDLNWAQVLKDMVIFKGFEVQKGNSDTVLRGFLILSDPAANGTYKLELRYYDGSWKTYTINSNFTGSQNDVDITVVGKLIIVTGALAQTITKHSTTADTSNVVFSGTYTGPGNVANYRVVLNATPSPDEFDGEYQQKLVFDNEPVVAASAFLLGDGISVTFGATNASSLTVRAVVRTKGAATIFWDDDAGDFTKEPSGSLFNDYNDGWVETPWGDGSTSAPRIQIPPGVLGFLSKNRFNHDQNLEDSRLEVGTSEDPDTGKKAFLFSDTEKSYGIAWRLRDTRRNLYTPMSIAVRGQLDAVRSEGLLFVHIPLDTWIMFRKQTTWDRLEIFRTIEDGSILYREWEIDLASNTGSASETLLDADSIFLVIGSDGGSASFTDSDFLVQCNFAIDGGSSSKAIDVFPENAAKPSGKDDNSLAFAGVTIKIDLDSSSAMPANLNRIGSFQGITLIQADGVAAESTDSSPSKTNSSLLYSPLSVFRPEMFPATNVIPIPQRDGKVQQFQLAGDFLYAVTANAMWRLQRSGARMAANRVNLGWGISNRDSMVEANNDLYAATRRGMLRVPVGTATPILLTSVERIMLDDWRTELASGPDTGTPGASPKIQTAFDAVLGAVFVLNRVKKELIVLWTATGQITTLEDVPWDLMTSLPDPVSGGSIRAWFTSSLDGRIYRAEPERTESLGPTFAPFMAKVQGTATSGSTTALTDTTTTFTSEIVGHIIYVDTGSGYEKATITSRSTNAVTFSAGLSGSGTVASGNRWILAPIRLNAVAWPLVGHVENDHFYRRTVHGMWAQPHVVSGTPNAKARWTYEIYNGNSATTQATVDATWDSATDRPEKLRGYLPTSGTILRPGWLCIEPEIHYELLSGRIKGKVKATDKVT